MPMKRIDQLEIDDMVDLRRDKFADPKDDHPSFVFEYQTVREIERETPDCVCVYWDNFSCGFPPSHKVYVAGKYTD